MQVAIEEHARSVLAFTLLNEFAVPLVVPESRPERCLEISLVGVAHDFSNGNGCFLGVVEGDGGDKMMQDMSTNNVMEKMGVNESEIPVYRCCGTTCKRPLRVLVVWETSVRVLEIRYSH